VAVVIVFGLRGDSVVGSHNRFHDFGERLSNCAVALTTTSTMGRNMVEPQRLSADQG
jgi:hypothetical protein